VISDRYLDIPTYLMDPMSPQALLRFVLAVIPALFMVLVGLSTVFGSEGLLCHQDLQEQVQRAKANLAEVERENQLLIYDLSAMERDPVAVERAVADELGYAKEGSTLYRFDPVDSQ
jgi:cell division protein FtsB